MNNGVLSFQLLFLWYKEKLIGSYTLFRNEVCLIGKKERYNAKRCKKYKAIFGRKRTRHSAKTK